MKSDKIIDAIGNINESMISAADADIAAGSAGGQGSGLSPKGASVGKQGRKTGVIAGAIAAVVIVAGISTGIILGYRANRKPKDPAVINTTEVPYNTEAVGTPLYTADVTPEPGGTEVPTAAETTVTAPTEAPTETPTAIPTEAPTETPTAAPTEAPTAAPTETPTAAPTETPTETPTAAPTEAPAPEYPDAISVAKSEYVIDPGESVSPEILFEPANTLNRKITWSLEEDLDSYGVAGVDGDRLFGWHPGSVKVIATAGNGVKAEFILKVRGIAILKLSETRLTMKPGDEVPLTVEVVAVEADTSYTYESDAPGIAVFENGKVKAISSGYATLTFRSADGSRTNYCFVTVESVYKPESERTQEDIRDHTTPDSVEGRNYRTVEFKSDKTTTIVGIYSGEASRQYYGLVVVPSTYRPCVVAYHEGIPVDYSYVNRNGMAQFFLDPGEYTFELEHIADDYLQYYRPATCTVVKMAHNVKEFVKTGIIFYERSVFPENCVLRVVDEKGNPVTGATIKLTHNTEVKATLITDSNGCATTKTLYYYYGIEYSQTLVADVSAAGFRPLTKYFNFNDRNNETISAEYTFVLKAE